MEKMMYTQAEVFRTAFRWVETTLPGTVAHKSINEHCICCKSKGSRIIDEVELRPWTEFFKTFEFAAYECPSCGYKWSWYKEGEKK
jgi:hypothetical protein